jgi:hypothetical protein
MFIAKSPGTWDVINCRRCGRERHAEHLIEVGGRIGADKQNPAAAVCQGNGGCRGNRRFTDAAFAREKEIAVRLSDHVH